MSRFLRIICFALIISCFASVAFAKYCIKLPTCEELGYVFPPTEGRRFIRCPFEPNKVLLLDYCQQYGLTSCDSDKAGECEQCREVRADKTVIAAPYYRYTRCKKDYVYNNGDCLPTNN